MKFSKTHNVYSIRDSKGEFFERPFFAFTHGDAERSFRNATNDPKTSLNMNPEDFDLYFLGEYDNRLGVIKGLETPQHIIKATHLMKSKEMATPLNLA